MLDFRNDKERIAFLTDYRNTENGWYLWQELAAVGRRFWRYDLPDCSLIVEEDQRTFTWPEERVDWNIVQWFIIKDWTFRIRTFRDQIASRSMALMEIKRIQKEQKKREQ